VSETQRQQASKVPHTLPRLPKVQFQVKNGIHLRPRTIRRIALIHTVPTSSSSTLPYRQKTITLQYYLLRVFTIALSLAKQFLNTCFSKPHNPCAVSQPPEDNRGKYKIQLKKEADAGSLLGHQQRRKDELVNSAVPRLPTACSSRTMR